jgi:HPt (histidine-containing phosphotransfer) domain-containing protein
MKAVRTLKSRKRLLIDEDRLEEIGGLGNPEICLILDSFTRELTGYLHLIEQQQAEKSTAELLVTLHKLSGASRTCGFSGISRAVDAFTGAPKPLNSKLHADLRTVIEASIEEWHSLLSSLRRS